MPLENPLGFGPTDYLEIALALLLVSFTLGRPLIAPAAMWLARRPAWCMLALALLSIALRVALLPHHPVPAPEIYDEFGHLFEADTLRHFRFANPTHPMHRFFETFFVLQQPTYSSIYPIGQGLMLALGRLLLGLPWAGVLLSTATLCALIYWMLRAWVRPEWALIGGLLAVMEFGPLSGWTNTYWGGGLAACAGCLVFGALPRILQGAHWRDGIALGLGLAIHLLTRPYESVLLLLSVMLFFAWARSFPWRPVAVAALFLIGAGGMMLLQNRTVTGNWLMMPYQLSQYQYGVPIALTFQRDPVPHNDLTPQQKLEYESQLAFRNSKSETPSSYLLRLEYRVRYYRFFFLPPLYVALAAYLAAFRTPYWTWVLSTMVLFALGSNFFPSFQVHYIAAVTGIFVLMSVEGLRSLGGWRFGTPIANLILFFCAAHFIFWYTLHLFENNDVSPAMERYETWNSVNHDNPTPRMLVNQQLARTPGQLLVIVRYSSQHRFQEEWVYNEADIDTARIVWARDRGSVENGDLIRYYSRRAAWLLDPDVQPPKLAPYQPEPEPVIETKAAPEPPAVAKPAAKPTLRFEHVK